MTQVLIDRAALEQLLVALEEVSDYINRYSIPAHQLELYPIDESIKTLNAALANAERVEHDWAYAAREESGYKEGWNDCMTLWADHMKRITTALKSGKSCNTSRSRKPKGGR